MIEEKDSAANALKYRLMVERLLIDKQKSTIHRISLLWKEFKPEIEFQPLREVSAERKNDLAKTDKEFQKLKTVVAQQKNSLTLKREILEFIWAKTPIQARSEEEKKNEPRGRPLFTLDDAKKQTKDNEEKKRDAKYS
jgi:hypothetical protein